MTGFPTEGRLAGIDYGTVRIGIALSDPQRLLASPWENYTRRDEPSDAQFFRRLVSEERVTGFVIGLPLHGSGQESQKSSEARQFGAWLHEVTDCPVRFYDERYTTREANLLLGEARLTRKKQKQRRDMLAAQLLLAAFLESDQSGTNPGPLSD